MNLDPAAAHSGWAALSAGLVTSLHCAGMCGPLTCAFLSARGRNPAQEGDALLVGSSYHVARLFAYGALGAVGGGLGQLPLAWVSTSVLRWLPWTGVALLVALAFRWDRHLPETPLFKRFAWSLRLRASPAERSPAFRAAMLGAATPLLPCGPLYAMIAFSLFSGSAARGAESMLAFGLGTVPALWLAQAHFSWLQGRLTPAKLAQVRAGLALAAAVVLAWRLRGTLGWDGPNASNLVCF